MYDNGDVEPRRAAFSRWDRGRTFRLARRLSRRSYAEASAASKPTVKTIGGRIVNHATWHRSRPLAFGHFRCRILPTNKLCCMAGKRMIYRDARWMASKTLAIPPIVELRVRDVRTGVLRFAAY